MDSIQVIPAGRSRHEMSQKSHAHELFNFKDISYGQRPISVATEFIDVDCDEDEDDEEIVSEIEEDDSFENSPRISLNSSGQRSLTTLSSYDEVHTPRSSRARAAYQFDLDSFKQVEGPRGPHLFRSSTTSSNSAEFENALSLSPMTPKAPTPENVVFSLEEADLITPRAQPTCFSREPLDRSDLARWSPAMVAQWMLNAGVEASMAETFIENDISGGILYTLKFEDLRELGIQSFGVRSKVWEEIHVLRDSRPSSPMPTTPIEDIPSKEVKKEKKEKKDKKDKKDGDDCSGKPKRSQSSRKKHLQPGFTDVISPLESVSIVGIEQMMPKPHHCSKGEKCSKWRRNQRLIEAFKRDHPFVDMDKGGVIMVAGDPGNPDTANKIQPTDLPLADEFRPVSDAIPSVVASSDVLGPGSVPSVQNLEEAALAAVLPRDPQDNVRQFLDIQRAQGGPSQNSEIPPTPPFEIFPQQQQQQPHQQLRSLPKLSIPSGTAPNRQSAASIARAASAAPSLQQQQQNRQSFVPYRMSIAEAVSPDLQRGYTPYRFGTPFSDMDIPVTAVPLGPVARDTSQSVPPDMNFRPQQLARSMSRTSKRPSVSVMPSLDENRPAPPVTSRSPPPRPTTGSPNRGLPASPKAWKEQGLPATCVPLRPSVKEPKEPKEHRKPEPLTAPPRGGFSFSKTANSTSPISSPPTVTKFDSSITHAGPMRKRKTKMLRHEWHEHYFTLKGTRLNMHEDAQKVDRTLEYIDIDDYAIACSSLASTNKLKSAFRSANIGLGKDSSKKDVGGFSFQLIPQDPKSGTKFLRKRESHMHAHQRHGSADSVSPSEGVNGTGKTHHFAVKSRDDRIDWMRELMLAKALRQKGEGFEISRNGNMI